MKSGITKILFAYNKLSSRARQCVSSFCRKLRCVVACKDFAKLSHAARNFCVYSKPPSAHALSREILCLLQSTPVWSCSGFLSSQKLPTHTAALSAPFSNHFSLNVLICMLLFRWERVCTARHMYASKNNSYHQDALRFYQKNVINNNFDIREMKTENDFDQSHVLLRPIILGIIYGKTFPEMRFFAIATAPAFELMTRDTQEVTLSEKKLLPKREKSFARENKASVLFMFVGCVSGCCFCNNSIFSSVLVSFARSYLESMHKGKSQEKGK